MRVPERTLRPGEGLKRSAEPIIEDLLVEALLKRVPGQARAILLETARRLAATDLQGFLAFVGRRFTGESLDDIILECADGKTWRAFRLARDVLGDQGTVELLREGRCIVNSRNGRQYAVRLNGEVRDLKTWGYRCVVIRGPPVHPLDIIVAKAIAVRDHPERISTLEGDKP